MTGSSRVLDTSVLVLNRLYMAVHVISARRAFVMLYRQRAEVIHMEDGHFANYDFESWCDASQFRAAFRREQANTALERRRRTGAAADQEEAAAEDWVRSVRFAIAVPRIIRLLQFDRAARQTTRFSRRSLFARDQNRCQYCGVAPSASQLSLDHVIPRSRGGETSWENVVCSCVKCNTKKGGRTPQEARMRLLKPPARPARNPLLTMKLNNPKYQSWRTFV